MAYLLIAQQRVGRPTRLWAYPRQYDSYPAWGLDRRPIEPPAASGHQEQYSVPSLSPFHCHLASVVAGWTTADYLAAEGHFVEIRGSTGTWR